MPNFPARGDDYVIDFDPTRGSEQGGKRPGLIVSNDVANLRSPVVTVVALTHTRPKKQYPQNVDVPPGVLDDQGGTVYCGQLLTVSKDRLGNYLGCLPAALMADVGTALKVHFDLV